MERQRGEPDRVRVHVGARWHGSIPSTRMAIPASRSAWARTVRLPRRRPRQRTTKGGSYAERREIGLAGFPVRRTSGWRRASTSRRVALRSRSPGGAAAGEPDDGVAQDLVARQAACRRRRRPGRHGALLEAVPSPRRAAAYRRRRRGRWSGRRPQRPLAHAGTTIARAARVGPAPAAGRRWRRAPPPPRRRWRCGRGARPPGSPSLVPGDRAERRRLAPAVGASATRLPPVAAVSGAPPWP